MVAHRRMLRTPWIDCVSNMKVVRLANYERELIGIIKIIYIGHARRTVLRPVMSGKIEGCRVIGRKQMVWRNWIGIGSI